MSRTYQKTLRCFDVFFQKITFFQNIIIFFNIIKSITDNITRNYIVLRYNIEPKIRTYHENITPIKKMFETVVCFAVLLDNFSSLNQK